MLRRLVKTGLAYGLHWTGADHLIGVLNGSKNMPLVIGYHRVVEDFAASARGYIPAMLISSRMLERQLDWIGRRFRFVTLDELGSRLEDGEGFDGPVAAITFDDGYSDGYYSAFPLLKRKGIPATFFVVTDLIGTSRLQIHDKLYLLLRKVFSQWDSVPRDLARFLMSLGIQSPGIERLNGAVSDPIAAQGLLLDALPAGEIRRVVKALEAQVGIEEAALKELHSLTWEMIAAMHGAGMTIGSHTKSHAYLTEHSPRRAMDEAEGSRQELERRLGIRISHFAYPDGRFNAAAVAAVANAGYRFGYSACRHGDFHYPLLTISRKLLWENSCLDALGRFSPAILSCQANGLLAFSAGCRQDHGSPAGYPIHVTKTLQSGAPL